MPQEKSYKILITKCSRNEDGYVFPGEIKTVKKLDLVKMRKAKIYEDYMKPEADSLAKKYKAKRSNSTSKPESKPA